MKCIFVCLVLDDALLATQTHKQVGGAVPSQSLFGVCMLRSKADFEPVDLARRAASVAIDLNIS